MQRLVAATSAAERVGRLRVTPARLPPFGPVTAARLPENESGRLASLRSLGLLDTEAEEQFDRVTRLAQHLLGVPIALVSLVDEDRQWFKSRIGLEPAETSRDASFCAHAIVQDAPVFEVRDARADERFVDNPLVTGDPMIRFYAGSPIAAPDGSPLGTLCIIDRVPRELTEEDRSALRDLAALVERELEVRQLAMTDPLTGVHNRRGFELLAAQALRLCRRHGLRATIVYLDLDGLKQVNDTEGHRAGDALILRAADVLTATFRGSDIVARVGGDEFALLLPGGDADAAIARLEAALEDAPGVSFSLGAVTFDVDDETDLGELLSSADGAMYEDKRAKRGSEQR